MHSINKILVAMFISIFSVGVMACDGSKKTTTTSTSTTSNPTSTPVSPTSP